MIYEVISNADMGEDFESEWFPAVIKPPARIDKNEVLASLQINCKNATGVGDGEIIIAGTGNVDYPPFLQLYSLPEDQSENSAMLIAVQSCFPLIKVKYLKNNNTGGWLSCLAIYV